MNSSTHTTSRPDVGRITRVVIGSIAVIVSPFVAFIGLIGAVVSANSCGMFGDGCDTYGQPADGHELMLLLFFSAPVAAVVGVVLLAFEARRVRDGGPSIPSAS